MKCLVNGCTNNSNQGEFIGDLCKPCNFMITTGIVGVGSTFIHDLRDSVKGLEGALALSAETNTKLSTTLSEAWKSNHELNKMLDEAIYKER